MLLMVTFALKHLFSSSSMRKELIKSHMIPWALEAFQIDQ
eukprot:IDg14050t1